MNLQCDCLIYLAFPAASFSVVFLSGPLGDALSFAHLHGSHWLKHGAAIEWLTQEYRLVRIEALCCVVCIMLFPLSLLLLFQCIQARCDAVRYFDSLFLAPYRICF